MKTALLAVCLLAVLALAGWAAYELWTGLEGVEMSLLGVLAMVGGAVVSLALGGGLMFLVFHSERNRDEGR